MLMSNTFVLTETYFLKGRGVKDQHFNRLTNPMLDFFPPKFLGVDCKKFHNIVSCTKTRVIKKNVMSSAKFVNFASATMYIICRALLPRHDVVRETTG